MANKMSTVFIYLGLLAFVCSTSAREVPSEKGLVDQKNFVGVGGVGGFSGIGSNGLPIGGVGGGVGGAAKINANPFEQFVENSNVASDGLHMPDSTKLNDKWGVIRASGILDLHLELIHRSHPC
ncbi:hypothetical protein CQW23_13567 [Capsicum baccatum]|uniref:Uncharacterized protein n=1 Tax=Capsicum baccatum TaxID=33114 RepID=A0A2G2WGW0_CAPBA|nr:hypothetical protein CQW23_13567 [Capsicum baccatum]